MILILWALLTAAAIPNEAIAKHITESAIIYGNSDAFAFGSDSRWNGIKLTGFIVLLALIAVSIVLLLRHRHWQIAVLLALSLILVDIWNVRLAMEYQPGFLVTFVLLPFWLILERKSDRYLTLLSVVSGTMIAFFDFLTTETLTVCLPLILIVAVRARENRLGKGKSMLRRQL